MVRQETPLEVTRPRQPQPWLVAELSSDAVRKASCSPPPRGDDYFEGYMLG